MIYTDFPYYNSLGTPSHKNVTFLIKEKEKKKPKNPHHVLSCWTDGIEGVLHLGNFISREPGVSSRAVLNFAPQGAVGKFCKHFWLSQLWERGKDAGIQSVKARNAAINIKELSSPNVRKPRWRYPSLRMPWYAIQPDV